MDYLAFAYQAAGEALSSITTHSASHEKVPTQGETYESWSRVFDAIGEQGADVLVYAEQNSKLTQDINTMLHETGRKVEDLKGDVDVLRTEADACRRRMELAEEKFQADVNAGLSESDAFEVVPDRFVTSDKRSLAEKVGTAGYTLVTGFVSAGCYVSMASASVARQVASSASAAVFPEPSPESKAIELDHLGEAPQGEPKVEFHGDPEDLAKALEGAFAPSPVVDEVAPVPAVEQRGAPLNLVLVDNHF